VRGKVQTDAHRYHWSVEYFEDLRNVNHCEFMIMKRSENNGRFILQNELRTWSELKKRTAANGTSGTATTTPSRPTPVSAGQVSSSPIIPVRRWGGCVNGCNHDRQNWPRRPMRKNTAEYLGGKEHLLPPAAHLLEPLESEQEDPPAADEESTPVIEEPSPAKLSRKHSIKATHLGDMEPALASPNDASNDASSSEQEEAATSIPRNHQHPIPRTAAIVRHLQPPQRGAGEGLSDDSDYFPGMQYLQNHRSKLRASSKQRQESKERKLQRRQTEQSWKEESGMGFGAKTDRLGDNDVTSDDAGAATNQSGNGKKGMEGPILEEALKGDMIVEQSEEDRERSDEELEAEKKIGEAEIEKMQAAERKSFNEVY
jgi:hypothetical protein